MSVLRFRRDRRQRDPFAGTPLDREPVPVGWNADGWPLVRDSIGVRPATGGEMTVPHGIATRETLAGLVEQAQAEVRARTEAFTAAAPAGRHAQPPWPPAADPSAPDLMAEDAHALYGWDITAMDYPPAHARPYAPAPPAPPELAADYRSLPVYRSTVRDACGAGLTAIGTRTALVAPPPPDFRISEMMHAHYAGMLAMHPGLGRAA